MESDDTLFFIAFFLSSLKAIDHYKHILYTRDVSNLSILYTLITIITSFIWLLLSVKNKSNLSAGFISVTLAMEMYVLYILVDRELFSHSIKSKDLNGENEEED